MTELIAIGWAILALVVPIMAMQKNRSGFLWFILALLLGPIALMGIALASSEAPDPSKPVSGFIRKCPFCGEGIRKDAVSCQSCGRDLTASANASE